MRSNEKANLFSLRAVVYDDNGLTTNELSQIAMVVSCVVNTMSTVLFIIGVEEGYGVDREIQG